MGLLKYFKRRKEEKDYLRRLYEKSGASSSTRKSKGRGKYPGRPIYAERRPEHVDKISCPRCGSHSVRSAGYADRFECKKCGKIFT